MTTSGPRRWHDLTTPEAAAAVEDDPVVILPLAAIEQHGPHLPLSTDLLLGTALLERAWRRLEEDDPGAARRVWTLPPQAVGTSREHTRFAGTLSLEPATLARVIHEIGASLARRGVRRLVLSNSHGGNRDVLHGPSLRLREEWDVLVVKATYFRLPRPAGVDLPETEWIHGFHGGAVETAMMLHLHPGKVHEDRLPHGRSLGADLQDRLTHLGPEGRASFAWLADDLNPMGTVGDARLATPEMGRRLVDGYAAALAEVFADALAFPLDRLSTDRGTGDGGRGPGPGGDDSSPTRA